MGRLGVSAFGRVCRTSLLLSWLSTFETWTFIPRPFGPLDSSNKLSKEWPEVERYALTDQIRRSSRSVNANIAEAWRKRRYPDHFVSKLSDADAEAAETQSWLDFALDHGYITRNEYNELDDRYDKVQGSLISMMNDSDQWCSPAKSVSEEDLDYSPDHSLSD